MEAPRMSAQLLAKPQAEAAPERAMPAGELDRLPCDEAASLRRQYPHDDRYYLELFRRAVAAQDDRCWSELLSVYRDQVQSWCRRSGATPADDLDELEALTWERFWRSYTPQKLAAADGLASVLRYVKLCARSVVLDEIRMRARSAGRNARSLLPDDASPPIAEAALDLVGREAFWGIVAAHLSSEAERVLVHLKFVVGLKSAEVRMRRPDLFPSASDVYRVTRNVLDRLRRSPAILAMSEVIETED
jgi:hypothetical protein